MHKKTDDKLIREQSRKLRDSMIWFVQGFTLYDPKKSYPGFYLSPQQSYVLTIVSDHSPISPGEVAKRLRLEKSHLTKIVNSLIEMNAVVKDADPSDHRKLILKTTAEGKRIMRELNKIGIDSYVCLMEKIAPSEREKVIHAIEVMRNATEELRKG
jgi:DNA-binding MarR family transcriptional regulator